MVLAMDKPKNFYTYDGYKNGKKIYNPVASETYLVPLFAEANPAFEKILTDLTAAICAEVQ